VETLIDAIVIGTGAIAIMDLRLAFLRRWRVPSLGLGLLGRWIGDFPSGVAARLGALAIRPAAGQDRPTQVGAWSMLFIGYQRSAS
jgi:hypothetical protein